MKGDVPSEPEPDRVSHSKWGGSTERDVTGCGVEL